MQIPLPDPLVQEVVAELLGSPGHADLAPSLKQLAQTATGARQIVEATHALASATLLAKTAMPGHEEQFIATVRQQTTVIQPNPTLVALALALVEAEACTTDDLFRDRRLIPDALFDQRLGVIKQHLCH